MSEKRRITAEDLYAIEIVSGSRLAPDGKKILFVKQRVDRETKKKFSNIFLIDLETSKQQQFTFGDQQDIKPEWSPDGEQIAFLSNRDNPEKPPKLFLISSSGGEARPLTTFEGMIDAFSWSPDGKKILFAGVKTDRDVLEREKDEQKKKLGVVAREYNRLFYKLDGFGFLPKERKHLWVVDVDTGEQKQLTEHDVFDETDAAWSPDGRKIVFLSNRSPDPDMDTFQVDLYLLPADGGEMRKIPTVRGSKSLPAFSPDGRWIAYYGAEDEGKMYKNTSLWVVPADGSALPENITEKYDMDVGNGVINDLGSAENMPPIWSTDGSKLYFKIGANGSAEIKAIRLSDHSVETILSGNGDIGSFTLNQDQQKAAYFLGTTDDPGQIFSLDFPGGDPEKQTQINRSLLDHIELGQVEEIWYQGTTGNPLQGWILKPPGFDENRQYPSILEIHGGPWAMYGNFFMHEFYYLAAQGYVVYFTNPRGGKGYGEAHAAAISNNWGGPDYEDLMAWVDLVEQKSYIDKNRMGVTGGSYGGYMTNWIIGHTDRFRAAVTQRCVSNLVSMWGSSDFNYIFEQEFGAKPPYEDIDKLWQHSPMKYMGNAKTPTMVIHSEMDLRCSIEQGEQVFVALKRLGVDSEFIRFPEEPHGLSRSGRTDRRIARLNHILRWFDKYLKE